jgi:Mrp family chromosome partitioning ATPase/capsular polysaccharide biosynthesis protein
VNDLALLPVIRRWWLALVLGTCVAGLAGYLAASSAQKTWEAQTDMLVGPVNTDVALEASGVLARTYADLAISRPALESALRRTNVDMSLKELEDSVSTTSNQITRLISIHVRSHDPEDAAALANALAARQIRLSNRNPADSTAAIDAFTVRPELSTLSPDLKQKVVDAAETVFGTATAGKLTLVERASVPTDAAAPVIPLLTLLATLGGLLVSGIVVLVLEGRDRRRLDERALADLEPNFLGAVDAPLQKPSEKVAPVESTPDSAEANEYRLLAARLELSGPRGLGNLLVVDSGDGSLAAVVALNLAAAAAQGGRRVLVADVNAGEHGLSRLLKLTDHRGYTDTLEDPALGNGRLAQLLVDRGEGLVVLPRGVHPDDRKLSSDHVDRVLHSMGEHFDLVILSGPSLSRSASALVWSRAADRTVCVLDDQASNADVARRAVHELASVNGRFAGTILGRRVGRFSLRRTMTLTK